MPPPGFVGLILNPWGKKESLGPHITQQMGSCLSRRQLRLGEMWEPQALFQYSRQATTSLSAAFWMVPATVPQDTHPRASRRCFPALPNRPCPSLPSACLLTSGQAVASGKCYPQTSAGGPRALWRSAHISPWCVMGTATGTAATGSPGISCEFLGSLHPL